MPMMKSPYDLRLSSLTGHLIIFTAGEPIHVPDNVVSEALARGVVHSDAEPPVVEEVAAQEEVSDNGEDEFAGALKEALTRILLRDDASDLKSDGTPKVNKVVAEMDPEYRRPTATEIADAYAELQENIDLAE